MPEYAKKTVAELTEILKGRSLPHSGKKAELIARLNEADKAAEASKAQPEPVAAPEVAPEAVPAPVAEAAPKTDEGTTAAPPGKPATEPATLAPLQAPLEHASREGSATTDAKLATAVQYTLGLGSSSIDEELRKRKARAERFGTGNTSESTAGTADEKSAEALKALERAKRFGTGATMNGTGVGKLDEALPEERERRGKRGREESSLDERGLQHGRGGKRRDAGGDRRPRGERPAGVKKATSSGLSEKDRLAAEARKKRFAA